MFFSLSYSWFLQGFVLVEAILAKILVFTVTFYPGN